MNTKICCRSTSHDVHSFYLIAGNKEYFLFDQCYRQGVHDYYSKGVYINDAIDHSKNRHDTAIARTMNKIPRYVEYIEQEYGLSVLTRTKRRNEQRFGSKACA